MALGTLSVDLVAKLAKFEGDMGKAARTTEATSARMTAALGAVKGSLAGLATSVTLGGIIAYVKSANAGVDALNDLKDATGASIENISALEDVAVRTGTTLDTVSTSMIKFNKVLGEASKPGSDAEKALTALGLSAAQLKSIDPAEALLQTAQALAEFADDGDKARLTQELFGKSLKEVAPFLKDLAEQGKLVATVTTQQAEEAEKFAKELFRLEKNSIDAARALTGPLITALNTTIDKFREGTKAGKGFGETLFDIYKNNLPKNNLLNLFGLIQPSTNTGGVTGDFGPGAGGGRGSVNPAFVKPSVGDPFGVTKKTGGGAKADKEFTAGKDALDSLIESLRKQLDAEKQLSEVEKVRNTLAEKGTSLNLQEAGRAIALAQQIDREKELAQVLIFKRDAAIAAGDAVNKSNEEYQALLKRLLDATPTANLEKQRSDVQLLTEEFQAGRIAEELYLEAVSARLDLTSEKIEKTKSLAEELGLTFTSAFEDAIVGGKAFSEILSGLEKDIIRIVTRKAVTEPLGNAVSSAFSGGGGIGGGLESLFKNIFSFDGGGSTGSGSRTGGMDGQGGFLAMLHPRETVVDHTRGQRAGNSVNVVVNQTFGAGTSRATTMQAAADARRQLEMAGRNL